MSNAGLSDPRLAELRRRRREMVRAHHPDRGGDPAVFIEVLRSLDDEQYVEAPPTEVRFTRSRRHWRLPKIGVSSRRHRHKRVL